MYAHVCVHAHTHLKDQQNEDQQKGDLNTDDKELWEEVGQHGLQRTYTFRNTHTWIKHTDLDQTHLQTVISSP